MDTSTSTPKTMNKPNPMIITAIVGVVLAAAGFGGGMMFQKSKDSLKGLSGTALQSKITSLGLGTSGAQGTGNTNGARTFFGTGAPGAGFAGRGRAGGGFVSGDIVSADATSITVKDATGSTKVVYYTSATTIDKTVTGAASDLVIGQNVTTNGTANSDGSVAATTIQLRPAGSTTPPVPAQ